MTAVLIRPRSHPRGPATEQRAARRRERKLPSVARGPGSSRERSSHIVSFTFMVPALRHINVGVSYSISSAVGTASIAVLGTLFFDERLNLVAVGGIVLIVGGSCS